MNVGSSEVPARPVGRGAGAPAAVEPTSSANGAGDGLAASDQFLAVLAQIVAPGATAPTPPSTVPCEDTATDDDSSSTDDVDWVVPFLAPPGTPTPVDVELLPSADDATGVLGASDALDGAPVTPLPRLVTDVTSGKFEAELDAADVRPADANPAQAATAPPARVETAANGAHAIVRTIPVPVSDHRWPAQVGHEVRILVERGVQTATLKLTPEHLGPVEVRIDIVNDKANVVFGAAQADTRAALTDAIPKLREMFAGAGLMLGDTGVRQQAPNPQPRSNGRFGGGSDAQDTQAAAPAAVSAVRVGLVDAYA